MIRPFHSKLFTHYFAAIVSMCFAICSLQTQANDYYFDATSGSNANTGLDPQNPWKGFAMFDRTTFVPGDTLHFKRGEVWHSTNFTLDASGTAASPITFTAYGAGTTNPVISGAAPLTQEYLADFDYYDPYVSLYYSGFYSNANNTTERMISSAPFPDAIQGKAMRMERVSGSAHIRAWRTDNQVPYGTNYTFSFWLRVDSGSTYIRIVNRSTCNFYDGNSAVWTDALPRPNVVSYNDSEPGWRLVTVDFTNDTTDNASVECSASLDSRQLELNLYSTGVSYIDNLSLSGKWSAPQNNIYYRGLLTKENSAFLATIADPTQEGGSRILNRKSQLTDLAENGDWFYDTMDRLMHMYWDGAEGSLYAQDIEVGRTSWYVGNILGGHVNIDGITFEKDSAGLRVQASNVSVNNSRFRFFSKYSLIAQDLQPPENDLDNISVTNSTFHTSGNGPYFVRLGNSKIANNSVHNITLAVQEAFTGVADNKITDVEAIPLQQTHDVVVEYNNVSNSRLGIDLWGKNPTGQSHTEESYNNIVRYNVVTNMDDYGIVLGGGCTDDEVGDLPSDDDCPDGSIGRRGHVHSNVVHNNILIGNGFRKREHPEIGAGIFQHWTPLAAPNYYYNNTMYANSTSFSGFVCTSGNFVFKNNLSLSPALRHLQFAAASWKTQEECNRWNDLSASVMSNNIYYPFEPDSQTPGQTLFNWHGTFAALSDYIAATSKDAVGSVGVDPVLFDPSGSNFLTTSLSPTIDAGVDVGLTVDYAGSPILGLPDIGAYEFGHNDTDNDGLTDYQEICYDGDCQTNDPYDPVTNPSGGDSNINSADTDGDGALDGAEVAAGFDPLDENSVVASSSVAAPLLNRPILIAFCMFLIALGTYRLSREAMK